MTDEVIARSGGDVVGPDAKRTTSQSEGAKGPERRLFRSAGKLTRSLGCRNGVPVVTFDPGPSGGTRADSGASSNAGGP